MVSGKRKNTREFSGGMCGEVSFRCCECGRYVLRDAQCWPGLEDGHGYPLTCIDVDQASAWLRMRGYAQEQAAADPLRVDDDGSDDGSWDWHPVQIERTQHARTVMLIWPGDVCRECYEECQDPAPWFEI